MLTLHVVQARFGDCLILKYGTSAKPRYLLVDGGPPETFDKHLDTTIRTIVTTGKLDLVVLSHVDNDHIVGLLDLFATLEEDMTNGDPARVKVGGLWHNSFAKTLDPDSQITQRMQAMMFAASQASLAMPDAGNAFFGIKEGSRLRLLAKKLGIPINAGFANDLIILETAGAPAAFGKLSLRVIGPTQANLDALRDEWLKWLEKTEQQMASNPATLANVDKSIPNLSSIVLLAECDGKKLLLTGDARSDHVVAGLELAGLLVSGKCHVDVMKVAHHGSNRNATATFFKNVTADTYVISANGSNDNPDHDTLKWIVEAARSAGRAIEIVVTNATPSTKKIKETHKPSDFGYKLTVKPKTDHSIAVAMA